MYDKFNGKYIVYHAFLRFYLSMSSQEDQIQKEYKIRALELHPDKIISDPCRSEGEKVVCNEKFQKLKKAKEGEIMI